MENKKGLFSLVRRMTFHIMDQCGDHCLFCYMEPHMENFSSTKNASLKEVLRLLLDKRNEGFNQVAFTGGEPTLYPYLWKVAAFAKKIGYRVGVISNGSSLSDVKYAQSLLPRLDELSLSCHGPNEVIHDQIAHKPGSFKKLVLALKNIDLCSEAPFVTINHVVTRLNISLLEQTIKFVGHTHKIGQFLLSSLTPNGAGDKSYDQLVVCHREMVSQMPAIDTIARRFNIALRVYGIPVCLLGHYWGYSGDLFYTPHIVVSRKRYMDGHIGWQTESSSFFPQEKYYPERCSGCVLRGRLCGGVYKKYTLRFGEDDIAPLTVKSLRQTLRPRLPLSARQEIKFTHCYVT